MERLFGLVSAGIAQCAGHELPSPASTLLSHGIRPAFIASR
jgi:hypothetical protein